MHGGIGRSIHSVEQIEKIERPITMDAGSIILMDLLWYVIFNLNSIFCSFLACFITYVYAGLILQKTIVLRD